jgi:hypothetical protein
MRSWRGPPRRSVRACFRLRGFQPGRDFGCNPGIYVARGARLIVRASVCGISSKFRQVQRSFRATLRGAGVCRSLRSSPRADPDPERRRARDESRRSIDAEAACVAWSDDSGIVQIAFRNEHEGARENTAQSLCFSRELFQKVSFGTIDEGMHGVNAQSIDMEVAHPHERVVTEEPSDLGRPGIFEIDRAAPGSAMRIGEIRAELACVVSLRTKVVVDDIQEDGEAFRVSCVYKALEGVRTAVRLVHCEKRRTVIAPAEFSRERRHGHQFEVSSAQINEEIELFDGGVECAAGSEGPDVQLVDDGGRQ